MDTLSIQIPTFSFFDVIVLLIAIAFFFRGFKKGFTREALSLVGFILGLFFASRLFHDAATLIDSNIMHFKNANTLELLGFITVFVVVWVSAILLGAIFGKLESANGLSFINRVFGAIAGGVKSFMVLSFFFLLISNTLLDRGKVDNITQDSLLYPFIQIVGGKLDSIRLKSHKGETSETDMVAPKEQNNSNTINQTLSIEN